MLASIGAVVRTDTVDLHDAEVVIRTLDGGGIAVGDSSHRRLVDDVGVHACLNRGESRALHPDMSRRHDGHDRLSRAIERRLERSALDAVVRILRGVDDNTLTRDESADVGSGGEGYGMHDGAIGNVGNLTGSAANERARGNLGLDGLKVALAVITRNLVGERPLKDFSLNCHSSFSLFWVVVVLGGLTISFQDML